MDVCIMHTVYGIIPKEAGRTTQVNTMILSLAVIDSESDTGRACGCPMIVETLFSTV